MLRSEITIFDMTTLTSSITSQVLGRLSESNLDLSGVFRSVFRIQVSSGGSHNIWLPPNQTTKVVWQQILHTNRWFAPQEKGDRQTSGKWLDCPLAPSCGATERIVHEYSVQWNYVIHEWTERVWRTDRHDSDPESRFVHDTTPRMKFTEFYLYHMNNWHVNSV